MKVHVQRLLVLTVVLVLCVTSLVVPCYAADVPRRGFQDWAAARGGGFGYGDEAYKKFIDDLNTAYGSVVFDSKGGYWIHGYLLEDYDADYLKVDNFVFRRVGFDKHIYHIRCNLSNFNFLWHPCFTLPLRFDTPPLPSGILFSHLDHMVFDYAVSLGPSDVVRTAYVSGVRVNTGSSMLSPSSSGTVISDGSFLDDSGLFLLYFNTYEKLDPFFLEFTVDLHRLFYFVPNSAPTDVINNTESRPGSLSGDLLYIGDDGSQIVANEIFVVNEGDKTVYNPVTGDTWSMDTWTYDYSTRSYEVVTTTGDTITVTYGDENITIYEGGNTINVYYGDPGGGGGTVTPDNPDTPDNPSNPDNPGEEDNWFNKLLEAVGSFLGGTVGGFVRLIASFFTTLLESLTAVVSGVVDSLVNLVTLFGSFGDALHALWMWLPSEVVTIMVAAVSVVVFGALIRLFMK